MSQPALRAMLADESGVPAGMPEEDAFLLRHLAAVAALLERHSVLYRELATRALAGEMDEEERARARDAAEQIATVGQSLLERQALVVAAQDTPLRPSVAQGVMHQLFHSFALLAGSEDEYSGAALTHEQLDELLELPGLRSFFATVGEMAAEDATDDGRE